MGLRVVPLGVLWNIAGGTHNVKLTITINSESWRIENRVVQVVQVVETSPFLMFMLTLTNKTHIDYLILLR